MVSLNLRKLWLDNRKSSHVGHDDNLRKYVARQAIDAKELPTFSGLPEEWPVFLEHFESTTKECQFSNAENMARLRKKVEPNTLFQLCWLCQGMLIK